jgi:hypothetical protein
MNSITLRHFAIAGLNIRVDRYRCVTKVNSFR